MPHAGPGSSLACLLSLCRRHNRLPQRTSPLAAQKLCKGERAGETACASQAWSQASEELSEDDTGPPAHQAPLNHSVCQAQDLRPVTLWGRPGLLALQTSAGSGTTEGEQGTRAGSWSDLAQGLVGSPCNPVLGSTCR